MPVLLVFFMSAPSLSALVEVLVSFRQQRAPFVLERGLERPACARQKRLDRLVRYIHDLADLDLAHTLVVEEGECQPLPIGQRLQAPRRPAPKARAPPNASPGWQARFLPVPRLPGSCYAAPAPGRCTGWRLHAAARAARRLHPVPGSPRCARASAASPAPRPRPPRRPAACAWRWPARSGRCRSTRARKDCVSPADTRASRTCFILALIRPWT